MKQLLLSLFVISLVTILSSKAVAQYSIPSYNVLVVADPTTFEETPSSSSSYILPGNTFNPFSQKPLTRGEKEVYIKSNDRDFATTAIVTISIYSLDGSYTYGPYTVTEGTTFVKTLDDSYEWGIRTLSCTEGCELDVWFE